MKKLSAILFFASLYVNIFAIDIVFRLSPGLFIPVTTKIGAENGFNGIFQLDGDLFGFLTVGAESLFSISPQGAINEKAYFYGGGLGAGVYYFPLSRLYLAGGASGGIYQLTTSGNQQHKSTSDIYTRIYGETGFRFTPEFTLSANVGYMGFRLGDSAEKNMNVSLSARYSIPLGKGGSSSFLVWVDDTNPAYPVFMKAYRKFPFASVTIINNEGAEVKNVHVSFRAGKYTSSSYESAVIPRIKKYGSEEIPLYADFSKEMLRLVENGKISGEIVIEYNFLGKKMTSIQNAIISVNSSNSYRWVDPHSLSCFISPDTPEILEFAKFVAGIARNSFINGINRNLQVSAAMCEALRLAGISYSDDKLTPYVKFHLDEELVDDIRYPIQTLNMGGGDYDDIGILLASCLESAGVSAGYIPVEDDFIVLVLTGIKPGTEENHFATADELLTADKYVYLPLSVKNIEKGFTAMRREGAKKIYELKSGSDEIDFYDVEASWHIYEPCAYSENGAHYEKPSAAQITKNLNAVIKEYISTDLEKVLARAKKSGDHNKIGLVYVRMNRYEEAKIEFQKSNSIKALNNLGFIYSSEKKYAESINMFKKVLEKDPENKTAKKGIDDANEKLMH